MSKVVFLPVILVRCLFLSLLFSFLFFFLIQRVHFFCRADYAFLKKGQKSLSDPSLLDINEGEVVTILVEGGEYWDAEVWSDDGNTTIKGKISRSCVGKKCTGSLALRSNFCNP